MRRRKKYNIVWFQDEDMDEPQLEFERNGITGKKAKDATAEQLAQLCDDDAENGNYHSVVGAHAELVKLFLRHVHPAIATKMMREIAERGGIIDFSEGE